MTLIESARAHGIAGEADTIVIHEGRLGALAAEVAPGSATERQQAARDVVDAAIEAVVAWVDAAPGRWMALVHGDAVEVLGAGRLRWEGDAARCAVDLEDSEGDIPGELATAAWLLGVDLPDVERGARREYGVPMGDGAHWGV